jgi:hypothetical protein
MKKLLALLIMTGLLSIPVSFVEGFSGEFIQDGDSVIWKFVGVPDVEYTYTQNGNGTSHATRDIVVTTDIYGEWKLFLGQTDKIQSVNVIMTNGNQTINKTWNSGDIVIPEAIIIPEQIIVSEPIINSTTPTNSTITQTTCDEESCVAECNGFSNCTVTYIPPVPTHESNATIVCHDGALISATNEDLRNHISHGDQVNECPIIEEITVTPPAVSPTSTQWSSYTTAELTQMLGQIFAELLTR